MIKKDIFKMDGDENVIVSRRKNVVSKYDNVFSTKSFFAVTKKAFSSGVLLQGVATRFLAFIAITSKTIGIVLANNVDAVTSNDNIDFFKTNEGTTVTIKTVTTNSGNGENVTVSALGNNLLVSVVTSTFDIIKLNDSNNVVKNNMSSIIIADIESTPAHIMENQDNYWALSAIILIVGTAAGNILVCLAIAWERRLQNVTNYFLMSLAITDLMVAILVMPLGILSLVKGHFPLDSVHCLVWMCLDVLFCTASIMHLCTISIDRYLSLRYPMRFGRNKTRKRVTVKIIFVWILSIAMSLPLCLMYSKDHASVLVDGTCQIPDPVYKLVGSIVCFYIPLAVMLITYCLTVRLLARQHQSLCGGAATKDITSAANGNQPNGWGSGWLGQQKNESRRTWRRLLKTSLPSTPNHPHSANSTDTELSNLDTHELWLPDSSIPEPTPSTMTALHQFGAEMLKLSRGLDAVSSIVAPIPVSSSTTCLSSDNTTTEIRMKRTPSIPNSELSSKQSRERNQPISPARRTKNKRRASHSTWLTSVLPHSSEVNFHKRCNSLSRIEQHKIGFDEQSNDGKSEETDNLKNKINRKNLQNSAEKSKSQLCVYEQQTDSNGETLDEMTLPPPCTCPYFGSANVNSQRKAEVRIVSDTNVEELSPLITYNNPIATASNKISRRNFATTLSSGTTIHMGNSAPSLHLFSAPSQQTISIHSLTSTPASSPTPVPIRKLSFSTTPHTKSNSVVTWDTRKSQKSRRGSSFCGHQTTLMTPKQTPTITSALRRSATLRNPNNILNTLESNDYVTGPSTTHSMDGSVSNMLTVNSKSNSNKSTPCLFNRCGTVRSHHSRNSSVISRNSSRHGRIIRLEQKATKVLGVVFFTFVILWAPFFVLNLLPTVCGDCEQRISHWVFDVVTWLGYASSMVNPIFYTIFNKVFRQAFKKVLMCQYSATKWRPQR